MKEKLISLEKVPKQVYHIVPVRLFDSFTDEQKTYDPRNRKNFGKNNPFIHTTPSIEQMNNHLTYLEEMPDKEFYLLEIYIEKLKEPKITCTEFNGRIYHHLWCSLPKKTYKAKLICKGTNGKIPL